MINVNRTVLTADEVAELLGLRRDYIYDLCRKNEIPYKRIGKRYLRFNLVDIEKWMHSGTE